MSPKTEIPWRPLLKPADVFLPGRLPLRVLRRQPQTDFQAHKHDGFHELVLIQGGHGLHHSGDTSTPLGAGDVFVISGEREHQYLKTKSLNLVNVVFTPTYLASLTPDLDDLPGFRALFHLEPNVRDRGELRQFLRLSPRDSAQLSTFIDTLEQETESPSPGTPALAKAAFLQIAAHLARCYASPSPKATRSDPLVAVARVVGHLEKNFREPQTLPQLSQIAAMSERSLRRHFTDVMGMGPSEYLLMLRLDAAKVLLKEGRLSVTEVAMEAGFSDGNYFSRQFKKAERMGPREWSRRENDAPEKAQT